MVELRHHHLLVQQGLLPPGHFDAIQGVNSSTLEVLAPVWVLLSQPIFAYSTSSAPLHQRLQQLRCLRYCSDCYRVERTSSRAGIPPLWTSAFHGALRINTYKNMGVGSLWLTRSGTDPSVAHR